VTTTTDTAAPAAPQTPPARPPRAELGRLLTGALLAEAVIAAAELGLADLMADGPRPLDDLAAVTGTHAPSLGRLLRCLAGAGLFAEVEPDRFGLTPVGACLREDAPEGGRASALSFGRIYARALADLPYSLRTGKPSFEHATGLSLFEYLAANPEDGAVFDRNMAGRHLGRANAALAAFDFAGVRRLVDVGGGQGVFLRTILAAMPSLTGVLFDLPAVVERAAGDLTRRFPGRVELDGGDFFVEVTAGADLYLLSNVLHDWDDDRAVQILATCRRAAGADARVLIVEEVLTGGEATATARVLDILMLVLTGGRERTHEEYDALLTAAGWQPTRLLSLADGSSIVVGVAE
jgi:hypothetical protein